MRFVQVSQHADNVLRQTGDQRYTTEDATCKLQYRQGSFVEYRGADEIKEQGSAPSLEL